MLEIAGIDIRNEMVEGGHTLCRTSNRTRVLTLGETSMGLEHPISVMHPTAVAQALHSAVHAALTHAR